MDAETFWSRVDKTGDCWLWTGAMTGGYGQLVYEGRQIHAHRLAYQLLIGPIPDGLCIDHLCRVTACVNPLHLEAVTQRVNILRGEGRTARLARKTHCIRGHELSGPNLRIKRNGARACRACGPIHKAAWRQRQVR